MSQFVQCLLSESTSDPVDLCSSSCLLERQADRETDTRVVRYSRPRRCLLMTNAVSIFTCLIYRPVCPPLQRPPADNSRLVMKLARIFMVTALIKRLNPPNALDCVNSNYIDSTWPRFKAIATVEALTATK